MGWWITIILGLLLMFYRGQLRETRSYQTRRLTEAAKALDLVILRLAVKRMVDVGSIGEGEAKPLLEEIDQAAEFIASRKRHSFEQESKWNSERPNGEDEASQLLDKIDRATVFLASKMVRDFKPVSSRDFERLNSAWHTLTDIGGSSIGEPPWQRPVQQTPSPYPPETASKETPAPEADSPPEIILTERPQDETAPDTTTPQTPAVESTEQPEHEKPSPPEASPPIEAATSNLSADEADTTAEMPPQTAAQDTIKGAVEDAFHHAWGPTKPSSLERALLVFSRWPKAFLPFLVQNVGWFIGTFCFVTGSIFLVAYTSGVTKTLVTFISLFSYTLFLIWGGYQLRVKRNDLRTASAVLLTTGMLLVPLSFSTIARMLVESGDRWWLILLSFVMAALAIGVFHFAAQLISGITDRALQGEHPRLFLLLTATQLCVPLVTRWPTWPLLAIPHVMLLATLAYGLFRYSHDWMHSIFVEQRKIAYFAAGTLLYAALISFVHLTWGAADLAVPNGYYGPYLMAVCGLLFYLDSQFKEWADRHVFLSRFTFFIYGLSVLAIVLVLETPAARLITLILSAAIYGVVTWKYLTVIPLYLQLASLMGLYELLILQHFSEEWRFLLSLPGLVGLAGFSRWIETLEAARPGTRRLALMSYRLFMLLSFGLTAWSLYFAHQGIAAMTSALLFAVMIWWALGRAPGPLFLRPKERALGTNDTETGLDLRNTPWLYSVTLAIATALFFAPPLDGFTWEHQFVLGLVLLAWPWSWRALKVRKYAGGEQACRVEALANSALLTIASGLVYAFAFFLPTGTSEGGLLALLSLSAAGVILWLSLSLYSRGLFYLFLVLTGAAGLFIKFTFFPGPSTGIPLLIPGIGIWFLLWWLDRQPDELVHLRLKRAQQAPPLTLLWIFPLAVTGSSEDVTEPLQPCDTSPHPEESGPEKEVADHV